MYDVIIIGKGPAGLSASLYTVRANLKTLIIGKNDSALNKADKIENYFGFTDIVSGSQLLKAGELQALRLGAEIVEEEVIGLEIGEAYKVITTKATYSSKAILLATGQQQKKANIENLARYEGNGVSYCTTCDGFFYRNLKVGVLGYKDFAVHEAIELEAFSKDIIIFTDGKKLDISENSRDALGRFKINTNPVSKLEGKDYLETIYFKDGSSEQLDGLFIAYDSASSTDFARKLGILTEGSSIIVDSCQQTNLEGVFAAGDCTGGFKQISTAVGQGAMAGRKIIEYVRKRCEKNVLKTGEA